MHFHHDFINFFVRFISVCPSGAEKTAKQELTQDWGEGNKNGDDGGIKSLLYFFYWLFYEQLLPTL